MTDVESRDPEPIHPETVVGHVHLKALYLHDPDGNRLELYWDRPRSEWPREPDGTLVMVTRRLDLEALLAEA